MSLDQFARGGSICALIYVNGALPTELRRACTSAVDASEQPGVRLRWYAENPMGRAMAFFEDVFEGNIGTGLAVGVGVAVLGPIVAPILSSVLRPVAKAVIRGGMLALDVGRDAAGRLNEMSGDLVSEARTELNEARTEASRRSKPA